MSALSLACPSCGARVDAAPRDTPYVYACHYCQAAIPIEPLAPPPAPAPVRIEIIAPARAFEASRQATAAAASAGKSIGCIVVTASLLPVLIPLFIFLGPTLKGLYASQVGTFPMAVGTNESIEVDDRTATVDDTVFTVGINGKLTIKRCHFKGPMLVKAATNAQITIVDSTFDGTKGVVAADGPNVVIDVQNSTITSREQLVEEASTNLKVTLEKKSKVTTDDVAIPAESNAEITVDDATLYGKAGAIHVKNNGKVKLADGADVKSDSVAIDLPNNGHVQISSAKVESKTTAIHGGYNLEGSLRNATIVGPKAALDVGSNAQLQVAQSSISGPKSVPRGSTVEER